MTENIKVRWLTDHEQTKVAPKTLSSQVFNEDGTLYKDTVNEALENKANKTDIVQSNWNQNSETALDYIKNRTHWIEDDGETYHPLDEKFIPDTIASKDYVDSLVKKLSATLALGFYCIEEVTVIVNGVSTVYPANSNVEMVLADEDVFEIVPTSNNSILSLNAYPGALGTFYPWLDGVKQFSNILFNMNNEDMYSKWSQGNQGSYQVQFAQYNNCIFWSDNPYISDVTRRTNYTLCSTTQLPLCYSTIPENTFKSFYLAFNANSDPNWSNPLYKNSFANANWATQAFSYYGARVVGFPGHDSPSFNIILPKDCRGLMFDARNIECAGTFDAINCTNFGAKSGSWREAFGDCISLRRLYIKNLKASLNISWSPVDYDSISYIISAAANTSKITISVSPYTYNLLSQSDFDLATSKNITIALLAGNYVEDKRLAQIANKADKTEVDAKIAELVNSAPETLNTLGELATAFQDNKEVVDALNDAVGNKANASEVLLKTEQALTDAELTQVRNNLKFIGKNLEGQTFTIDGEEKVAAASSEIFGDYDTNIAVGQWSIAEGSGTKAIGRASHAEGAYSQAVADGSHVEGYQTKATGYWSHAEGELTVVSSYASHAEGSYCTLPDGAKRYGTAAGYASHIEGGGCHATGSCSHAEGLATTVSGAQSHAEGRYTIAASGAQHVEGIANIEDANEQYIHIAGNGTWDERSNAHTLDWQGNAWFSGDVYVGSTSGLNKDEGSLKLATENYVDTKFTQGVTSVNGETGAVTINAASLGLTSVMKFHGVVDALPATSTAGSVVLMGNKEYVYDSNENWVELGDEGSHALKTISFTAGSGLTGGGTLEANRTIGHSNIITAGTATGGSGVLTFGSTFTVPSIAYDTNGHITSWTTNTYTLPEQINIANVTQTLGDELILDCN